MHPSGTNFALTSYGIRRPEKLRWWYDIAAPELLASIPSKTLRQLGRQAEPLLQRYQLTVTHSWLDALGYQAWWQHYQTTMQAKGYDLIATPDWWQHKQAEGKQVGVFYFHQSTQVCGSLVYLRHDAQVTACFKTSQSIPGLTKKHRSLGALIDFVFLREILKTKPSAISLGSMRNAFGVWNSYGNLEYKLSMGYLVEPKENTAIWDTVPLDADGRVAFFGWQADHWQLFAVKATADPYHFPVARFQSDKIGFSIINY